MMSITDHSMVQKTLRTTERHGIGRLVYSALPGSGEPGDSLEDSARIARRAAACFRSRGERRQDREIGLPHAVQNALPDASFVPQ